MTERRGGDEDNLYVKRWRLRDKAERQRLQTKRATTTRLMAQLAIARGQNEQLKDSVKRLSKDKLVPGLYSEQGFRETLKFDKELQETMRIGNFGIIGIDARGVKALNDTSLKHGDELLLILAERGLTPSLRHNDYITRRGDDFAILVGRVTPEQLEEVKQRIADSLSVSKAIEDIERGAIPVMASVSSIHASELHRPRGHDSYEGLVKWYENLENEAGVRNVGPKHRQYDQMWESLEVEGPKPRDERRIADEFFERYCPHFVEQIEVSMRQRELNK